MQIAGFDWNDGNRSKCRKHGVSQAAIESMFRSSLAVLPDPLHSKSEERFKAIGKSDDGRWIFIVFTLRTRRGQRLVRPISARYMHKKEVDHYEKETAKLQKR
ncbi:MAG: BrnT family toxin [Candidatus Binataceae bacterium]